MRCEECRGAGKVLAPDGCCAKAKLSGCRDKRSGARITRPRSKCSANAGANVRPQAWTEAEDRAIVVDYLRMMQAVGRGYLSGYLPRDNYQARLVDTVRSVLGIGV